MEFLSEDEFNAAFGKRLRTARDALGMSRPTLAGLLGITKDQLKHYENRSDSAFPLYLLPALIHYTGEPYAYWAGDQPSRRARFYVVQSSKSAADIEPASRGTAKKKPQERM